LRGFCGLGERKRGTAATRINGRTKFVWPLAAGLSPWRPRVLAINWVGSTARDGPFWSDRPAAETRLIDLVD